MSFNQLLALHNKLLRNEDPTASQGLSLVLTTRPSCTFRLKKLVQGANNGMGLSKFQEQPTPHKSSGASDYDDAEDNEVEGIEAGSQDISLSEDVYEDEAEVEHES